MAKKKKKKKKCSGCDGKGWNYKTPLIDVLIDDDVAKAICTTCNGTGKDYNN